MVPFDSFPNTGRRGCIIQEVHTVLELVFAQHALSSPSQSLAPLFWPKQVLGATDLWTSTTPYITILKSTPGLLTPKCKQSTAHPISCYTISVSFAQLCRPQKSFALSRSLQPSFLSPSWTRQSPGFKLSLRSPCETPPVGPPAKMESWIRACNFICFTKVVFQRTLVS